MPFPHSWLQFLEATADNEFFVMRMTQMGPGCFGGGPLEPKWQPSAALRHGSSRVPQLPNAGDNP